MSREGSVIDGVGEINGNFLRISGLQNLLNPSSNNTKHFKHKWGILKKCFPYSSYFHTRFQLYRRKLKHRVHRLNDNAKQTKILPYTEIMVNKLSFYNVK